MCRDWLVEVDFVFFRSRRSPKDSAVDEQLVLYFPMERSSAFSRRTLFRKPTHPTYIFRIWSLPPSDRAPILSFILSNSLRYFSLLSHSGIPLGNTRLAGYPVAGQTIMIPLLRRNTGSQQLPEKTINPSIPADENYIMTWPSF